MKWSERNRKKHIYSKMTLHWYPVCYLLGGFDGKLQNSRDSTSGPHEGAPQTHNECLDPTSELSHFASYCRETRFPHHGNLAGNSPEYILTNYMKYKMWIIKGMYSSNQTKSRLQFSCIWEVLTFAGSVLQRRYECPQVYSGLYNWQPCQRGKEDDSSAGTLQMNCCPKQWLDLEVEELLQVGL